MAASTDRTRRSLVLDDAADILARTPLTLGTMLRRLPHGWADAHEGGDTWSALDVVGHLIHCDRTNWLPRVMVIIEHGETRAFDDFDRFGHVAHASGQTVDSLLDEFASVRRESLQALASLGLTNADIDRRGTHPALGAVTLRQLLSAWVAHDLDHVMQITRVLASQYADEVGPWRSYLRIVRDAGTSG